MSHLLWAPSLLASAAVTTGSRFDWGTVALVCGGAATLISAITGLVVALRRQPPQVVVVNSQDEADALTARTAPRRRSPRRGRT